MPNMKWGTISVGTVTVPQDADAFEWVRLFRITANRRGFATVPDFSKSPATVEVLPADRRRKRREIVPGCFVYPKWHGADAHYHTARNQGFVARLNKTTEGYKVTVL